MRDDNPELMVIDMDEQFFLLRIRALPKVQSLTLLVEKKGD